MEVSAEETRAIREAYATMGGVPSDIEVSADADGNIRVDRKDGREHAIVPKEMADAYGPGNRLLETLLHPLRL